VTWDVVEKIRIKMKIKVFSTQVLLRAIEMAV